MEQSLEGYVFFKNAVQIQKCIREDFGFAYQQEEEKKRQWEQSG
jgi:hypothetical protein